MNDLLFTKAGDKYPWAVEVRVSSTAEAFEFSLGGACS